MRQSIAARCVATTVAAAGRTAAFTVEASFTVVTAFARCGLAAIAAFAAEAAFTRTRPPGLWKLALARFCAPQRCGVAPLTEHHRDELAARRAGGRPTPRPQYHFDHMCSTGGMI
ncbi:hypothetical protein AB595_18835 [Massilia sp. WF1]|nr:hypothetical protein AB595_18835 [Massilia sp. WF1]